MINLAMSAGVYLIILGISQLLYSKRIFQAEGTRRLAHVLSGVFTLFLPLLVDRIGIYIIASGFTAVLVITKRKQWFGGIHQVVRQTHGAMAFPIGVAATAALTLPNHMSAFVYGILVLTFSDSLAALFGKNKRILPQRPWWEGIRGSIVFLSVSLLIGIGFVLVPSAHGSWIAAIVAPPILTLTERYTPLGFDNVTVPVLAGTLWMVLV